MEGGVGGGRGGRLGGGEGRVSVVSFNCNFPKNVLTKIEFNKIDPPLT